MLQRIWGGARGDRLTGEPGKNPLPGRAAAADPVRRRLPDRFLVWLANSVSDNQWQLVTIDPLAAMAVVVVVIPVVRGFLQSRTARRVAVVSMKESARELCAKAANARITKAAGELCSTAYRSVRDCIAAKAP